MMVPRLERHVALVCALFALVAHIQARQASPPAQNMVWRPVSLVAGPIDTPVQSSDSDNELRVQGNHVVLLLADGQQWSMPIHALQSIRYFRKFARPSGAIVTSQGVVPNPGWLWRHANHFLDLVFSDETNQEPVLTLEFDKHVFRSVLMAFQQLTALPVLTSAEDAKDLPAALKTQQIGHAARAISPRHTIGGSVALKLAVNTDGRLLAAVLRDGSAQVWDLETGQTLRRWPALEASQSDWQRQAWIAFRPGSALVAVSAPGSGIQQWDARSGVRRDVVIPTSSNAGRDGVIPATSNDVNPFWFAPDGSRLIVADRSEGFSCWDPEVGTRLDCLDTYRSSLKALVVGEATAAGKTAAFSSEGTQLVLGTAVVANKRSQSIVTILEWPGGRVVQQQPRRTASIGEMTFVGGDRVIERNWMRVQAWQLARPEMTQLWNNAVLFHHDAGAVSEQLIAIGGRDRKILLFSTATGRVETPLATSAWASTIAFLPGGRLAVATFAGAVQIWDTSARRLIRTLSSTP
jgi:hypothetical protein